MLMEHTGATGGSISIRSGFSTESSSGTIIIRTLNAGAKGVSGELMFSTGITTCGASGSISIGTGTAAIGEGGDVFVSVGDSNHQPGGMMSLKAGTTSSKWRGNID